MRSLLLVLLIMGLSCKPPMRDYSPNPPGGLKAENVPQFVIIGADDCGAAEAVNWLVDYIGTKTNPKGSGQKETFDGTSAKMAFYVNGVYAKDAKVVESWKNAYKAGHEIGNHTFSHFLDEKGKTIDARLLGDSIWYNEIVKNDTAIMNSIGMKYEEIIGFRVPRLEYNESAFKMMAKRGFVYDCSIEEGSEPGQNGTNYFWPYTLDNGSMADSLMKIWSSGEDDWGYKPCGKVAGLWEIPVYNYIVPEDKFAEDYGFEEGLRKRIHEKISFFDPVTGNLTGFDYNVFAPGDWAGAEMKNNEYLAVLKYSFDQHIKGNRTPFTMGMHPDFYMESQDEYYGSAGNYKERRKVVENFIDYALSFEDVRFVTVKQLLQWLENPVALK